MQAATNFATMLLRRAAKRGRICLACVPRLAGNTLNRRGDSFRCCVSHAAALPGPNFFMHDPRKPGLRRFFQPLAATFLL